MGSRNDTPDGPEGLRERAEEIARREEARASEPLESMGIDEIRLMLHELHIHQIELEMQNEELRKTQVELEESRARYVDLYELAPVGYVTVSERGTIVSANLTAARLLRVNREDLIASPISRHIHRDDQDTYYHFRRQLFSSNETQTCQVRLQKAYSHSFWAEIDGNTVQGESGERSINITFTDISPVKEAQEQRERLNDQLSQARKRESVGRLAGGVAHNLNNLLTVILGNADLSLWSTNLTDSDRRRLQSIRDAVRNSTEITARLVAYAREQLTFPRRLNLVSSIEASLPKLQSLVPAQIKIDWKPATSPCHVNIDPAQLEHILVELTRNAGHAIEGAGCITLETGGATLDEAACAGLDGVKPGQFVRLTIADDGCGMEEIVTANVFEPFFTTREIGQGTGLGLSSVFGIVAQNHGVVRASSKPGEGTTFEVLLPCVERE